MRKQRTREHIIEDLGFNHVERQVLHAGYVFRRINKNDYGNDGTIETFNERGEAENLYIFFQLKSTDHIQFVKSKKVFTFDLSKQDLELWLYNRNPVILLLFDAQKELAYYIDLQAYFNKNRTSLQNIRKFVRVYIPETAVFETKAVVELRKQFK
jgi:hypothetical protein